MLLVTWVAMISRRSAWRVPVSRLERLAQRLREVALELAPEIGIVRHVGVEQLVVERDLGAAASDSACVC
jgi:hypothetical protein